MSTAAVFLNHNLDDDLSAGALCIPASASRDIDGFLDWINGNDFPENLRIAWHEGDILFDMSPENIDDHARLKAKAQRLLEDLIDEEELGIVCPDGVTFVNKKADVAAEPDVQMVLAETLESGKAQVRRNKKGKPTAIEGSPDLIVEVVSESSVDKDYVRWVQAYHRAGVREYWILDGLGRDLKITIYRWSRRGFLPVPVNKASWKSPVLSSQITLSRKRGRFGFWNYRFEFSPNADA